MILDGDSVKETLTIINAMLRDGVIGRYAIGGAVGATHYLEPAATLDIDIFVILPASGSGPLLSLSPIYEYLEARGGVAKHEHIVIGGWPVQFLVPSNDLEREAVADAIQADVEGVPTWIMPAEHLAAIALKTGRVKDQLRILRFLEEEAVDLSKLEELVARHGLSSKWREFKGKYPEATRG